MSRVRVVARATALELLRRRAVVALLFLVPLAFYLARHDLVGQSIRFASIGTAWALSTLAAFAGLAGQAIEPRLRLSGYRTRELLGGRVLGLAAMALPLVTVYSVVILADQRALRRWPGVVLGLVLTAAVAIPFGLLVAAILRRPLEAAMLLLVVSGLQMILDPGGLAARFVPFWSVRELLTWTVDGADGGYLRRALLHAAASVVLLGALTVLIRVRALRRRPHLRLARV
jgi:ABC-type Na+ efflux pump permease subunit